MSLRLKILVIGLAITILAALSGVFYVERVFRASLIDDLAAREYVRLERFVSLLEKEVQERPMSEFAQSWVVTVGTDTFSRVMIVGPSGHVVADSSRPLGGEGEVTPQMNAPELKEALEKGTGIAERESNSRGERLLHVARRYQASHGAGVVRISEPLQDVERAVARARNFLWTGVGLLALLLLVIVGMISRDLRRSEQTEKERRQFYANLSHELRTPLTAIHGYAETLKGELAGKEPLEKFSRLILKHSESLTAMVNDLLQMERLEQHDFPLRKARVDLGKLAGEAGELLEDQIAAKGIEFELGQAAGKIFADGDARLLSQVLVNLLGNAIRHTPGGGKIRVTASQEERNAVLEVSNTGSQIPETDLKRIFERFYRSDEGRSREAGGMGLGLAIVQHIARRHGGQASAENLPGGGVRFRVSLPAA